MTAYNFSQLIDFTRTSSGTFTDSTGKLTYAPNNLVTFSEQFDNAAWTKTYSSIVANVATAPDGTSTADKLVEDTTNNGHNILAPGAVVVGNTYVHSVYLKAAGRNIVEFYGSGFVGQGFFAKFNLSNGTMFTNTGSRGAIQSVGNGWYRCSIWLVASGTSALTIALCDGSGNNVYIGDGTSGVFMWGAQLEQVTYQTTPGTYVATTSSAYQGPRFDYDPVTLAPKGLLIEDQRTNLLLRSSEFSVSPWTPVSAVITPDTATAPDGTSTADTIAFSGAGQYILQNVAITLNTVYTISFYIRTVTGTSNIKLVTDGAVSVSSNIPVTTQWQRITFTSTASRTSGGVGHGLESVGASSFYIWGAQVEAGAFATSYIPTVASTVTRSADVAQMLGTNFSSWYNQAEGALVMNVVAQNATTMASLSDGSINNRMASAAGTLYHLYVAAGGVEQANIDAGTFPVNTSAKLAFAYAANNFAAVIDNGAVGTDTSGSVPVVNKLSIGMAGDNTAQINGHIRSIRYYPTRLTNAQLQALTA